MSTAPWFTVRLEPAHGSGYTRAWISLVGVGYPPEGCCCCSVA